MDIQNIIDQAGEAQDAGYHIMWFIDFEPFPYWDECFNELDMTRVEVWTQGQIAVALAEAPKPHHIIATGTGWDASIKENLIRTLDPLVVDFS